MTQSSTTASGAVTARPGKALRGSIKAPGDKSISHRSLILGGLASGETRITGLLESDDVLNTAKAVEALGADVERTGSHAWRVGGCAGRFTTPAEALDFGNSGTGVRLMMGAVAGTGAGAHFIGDESLSGRPMRRVTDPLSEMGARFQTTDGRLPASLDAGPLHGIRYRPPIASAQVKSAILLAGLGATGETCLEEPRATRNHTETMLDLFGVALDVQETDGGSVITLTGPQTLQATQIDVPGDPSSAAFAIVAALTVPGSEVSLSGVMNNPTRTGLLTCLEEMGADLTITPGPGMAGEETIDITARYRPLKGIDVPAERAPSMIDEYPILAVAAASAEGTTRMNGLAELKAKESDRLASTAAMLKANGVEIEVGEDSLTVHGKGPGSVPGGGLVATHHDHRLAMSGLVLGLSARSGSAIDDAAMIATSYPDFFDHMAALGADIQPASTA